jgi:two-component system, LytTR family, response regulator
MTAALSQMLISSGLKSECIKIEEIIRAEAFGSHALVHLCCGKQLLYSYHLKVLEKLLCDARFFRVHKSHLINLNFIQTIVWRENLIIMINSHAVPLSERNKSKLKSCFGK